MPNETVRTEEGEVITYSTTTDLLDRGVAVNCYLTASVPQPGTGWPGRPETQLVSQGILENFKPERIEISDGFSIVQAFVGAQYMFPVGVQNREVPSDWLKPGMLQPEYPTARKGVTMMIAVKNTGSDPACCTVKVIGRRVEERKDIQGLNHDQLEQLL